MARTGSPSSRPASGRGGTTAARLVISAPVSLAGRVRALPGGSMTLGRSPDADIVLPVPTVSRRHARLWPEEGGWWLMDIGSAAGTTVNGRPIGNAPYRLSDGDRIALAEVELTFRAAPAADDTLVPGAGGGTRFDVGPQSAEQINNVGRDQINNTRATVDLDHLSRSRPGRTLIYLGVLVKIVGTVMALYWVFSFMSRIFDAMGSQSEPSLDDLPALVPWVGGGTVLVLIGTSMWITGAVMALSAKRRRR